MIAMIPPNRPNLIPVPAAVCLAFLLLTGCFTSCVVVQKETMPQDASPRPVRTLKRWAVELDGKRVGRMTLLRIEDPVRPETLYKVEHADGQHAGWIDLRGRAFRNEPFREGLVLVGMDTMAEDLRTLLELRSAPTLRRLHDDGRLVAK